MSKPKSELAWSALIHLGMNEWHELPYRQTWPNMTDPVLADAIAEEYVAADHVRFDEAVWRRVSDSFVAAGMNQLVIDLGEAVQYPSHPEIGVKGAWSPEKLQAELHRLRAMGVEPIPKLNLSTTHDIWLGEYHRMVSTPPYYRVVSDLIHDVAEIFERPRYFHLGLDEETLPFQEKGQKVVIIRKPELWWHDVNFYFQEVEKQGARAWVWCNCTRTYQPDEYVKHMPKSVVQSPWWYMGTMDPKTDKPALALEELARLDYDVVPCSSNCYSVPGAMSKVVSYCRTHYAPTHLLGFQMAPWLEMNKTFEPRWKEAAQELANAIRAYEEAK